jgi:lysozyme family protein
MATKKWTYEGTKRGYANLWAKLKVDPAESDKVRRMSKLILRGEDRYKKVEAETGVPWFFIGALHMRESGCSFDGVLHNGDKIIGTGRLTYHVPKGRGPFNSWVASAVDALEIKGLHKITDWNISRMGFEGENFNGRGYIGKGVNSPYLWGSSNLEEKGKYVRDHTWDSDFDDPQVGVMTVLKDLCSLRSDINERINGKGTEQPKPKLSVVETEMAAANLAVPMKESPIAQATVVGGGSLTIGGLFTAAWDALKDAPSEVLSMIVTMAQKPTFWFAIGTMALCAYIYFKRKGMKL